MLLPHKIEIGKVLHPAGKFKIFRFSVLFKQSIQFGGIIEEIFQNFFVPSRDDKYVFDP